MAGKGRQVGTVTSVNPARRTLRVRPVPGGRRLLEGAAWVHVTLRDDTALRCRVASVAPGEKVFVVTLAPGVTRDTVARMKGASVALSEEGARAGDDTWHHVSELLEFTVLDEGGHCLGAVAQVYATGTNAVLEIEKAGGGTVLVPAIDEVIAQVDVRRRALTVRDIAPYAVEEETHDED